MIDLIRLLQAAPTVSKLAAAAAKAQKGDPSALAYLKSEGWAEALDVAVHPGAGQIAKQALGHAREAYDTIRQVQSPAADPNVIDGEYSEVLDDTPIPWGSFLTRLLRLPYGGHLIIGPIGGGKTSLATRLAKRVSQLHGFDVECVNYYPNDLPPYAVTIGTETLIHRMKMLTRYLKSFAKHDEEEEWNVEPDPEEESKMGPPKMPPRNKVIIIDEMSLALSNNPNDPGRRAAIQALMQCRHLNWIVIFIAQQASLLPLPLFQQTISWVKQPLGDESDMDRDNPFVKMLWARASEAFADMKNSPWYRANYGTPKAWTYCHCRALDGGPGYTGLIPFSKPEAD